VIIVDSADDLNRNAANAFLKNLEEPPANTLFLAVSQLSVLVAGNFERSHTRERRVPSRRAFCTLDSHPICNRT